MTTRSSRRNAVKLSSSSLLGAGLAACGSSDADDKPPLPAFVLVHGAWHNSSTYTEVIAHLSALGHAAVAVDLPGHGLRARLPASWLQRPFDAVAFSTEPSPVANVTLADYTNHVIDVIDKVRAQGHERVVLVGHSLGGNTITAVGEAASSKLSKLVYLTAFLPFNDRTALDVVLLPESSASEVATVQVADPTVIGAQRIDVLSPDAAYRAKVKSAFYGDLSDEAFSGMAHLLTPDEPIGPAVTPIHRTAEGWGSIERHFIKCTQDRALVPAMAQKMIDTADAEFPQHKTKVHELNTSHSPFLSEPQTLAKLLSDIARA